MISKIILRGRQQRLFHQYKEQNPQIKPEVHETAKAALKTYMKKNIPGLSPDLSLDDIDKAINKAKAELLDPERSITEKDAESKMHFDVVLLFLKAIKIPLTEVDPEIFYSHVGDVMLLHLDSLHGVSADMADHSFFTRLTKKYEARFMEDIMQLNCLMPDTITRVSEYVPKIVSFVEKIEGNGFTYKSSDGSVYFDIKAFENANHSYAKLEPWNRNNRVLQADGEGALSSKSTEKRSDADFVLWKSSKAGEPSWPSPWGNGRPGWHIECSAMASDVLGRILDIHSGGIDLAFPHHDNELAQSEAYWHCAPDNTVAQQNQWVNYFLHMGHLSIQGSKMSKSLKNFITIREALSKDEWTPRGLRIIFLLTGWKDRTEITPFLIKSGLAWEDKVNNFFLKAKDLEKHDNYENFIDRDKGTLQVDILQKDLEDAKAKVHAALCDSFDTANVMLIIADTITKFNSYDKRCYSSNAVFEVASWITSIIRIFGLDSVNYNDTINSIGWSGIEIPEHAKPHIFKLSALRDEVRQLAITNNVSNQTLCFVDNALSDKEKVHYQSNPYADALKHFQQDVKDLIDKQKSKSDYLSLCDRLRDQTLWELGIYLEDRDGQPAMIRPVDRELRRARAERAAIEVAKAKARDERQAETAKRMEVARVSPAEMFKTDEYGAWDENGLPTKDSKGNDITKSRAKKLKKDMEKQKKLHEIWFMAQKP